MSSHRHHFTAERHIHGVDAAVTCDASKARSNAARILCHWGPDGTAMDGHGDTLNAKIRLIGQH